MLVNTSFNVRSEPIVCTPEDAFRCFMGNDIELLVVGNCMLRKSEQNPRSRSITRTSSSRIKTDLANFAGEMVCLPSVLPTTVRSPQCPRQVPFEGGLYDSSRRTKLLQLYSNAIRSCQGHFNVSGGKLLAEAVASELRRLGFAKGLANNN